MKKMFLVALLTLGAIFTVNEKSQSDRIAKGNVEVKCGNVLLCGIIPPHKFPDPLPPTKSTNSQQAFTA